MTISFDTRRDAPLGTRPELEGDSQHAFDIAKAATEGLVDSVDRIRRDTTDGLSADGKERLVAKERLARQEKLDRATALIAREQNAVDVLDQELRRDAGLSAPTADGAEATRHREIRDTFSKLGPSDRLAAIRQGDRETLAALFHAPALSRLLGDAEREVVEKKLLMATDPKRFAAILARRQAHAGASYAVEAATRWSDARTNVNTESVRARIAGLKQV